jgi:hypothetical protein
MTTDPSEYLDSLNNRRWDSANACFEDEVDQDMVVLTFSWRLHDDVWVREFVYGSDIHDKQQKMFSVRFDPLKDRVEGINISTVEETLEDEFDDNLDEGMGF